VSSFRTNLREPLSSFVGRERELAAVGELLAEHRLVTLTGAGGSGKTRLALRAAVTHRDLFPDGVWLLELGPLADGEAIPAALSSVLEVVAQPGQAVIDRVIEFLSDRGALLVVDNCEHMLDAVAGTVRHLLGACPNLVVLTTSREALPVAGEHTFAVPPMADLDAEMSDGVRLFVERVQEERASFELTDNNRTSVETICARLDHLPLAIELAAARAAAMGTNDIASRLDERFRLLTAGSRGGVERHRTLQAAVEWSYALLDADERAVFDVLAVFAGTFDLDAVLAVCTVEGLDHFRVIDSVGSLVAKSMVVLDEHPTLGARYRLLETLRAYGLECLEAACQLEAVRTRHAAHYCRLAHTAAVELYGPSCAHSGQQLLVDAPDHRAAHAWLMTAGRAEDALGHATDLLNTSVWRGWREPVDWLRAAMADRDADGSPYRPQALAALAYYAASFDFDMAQADRLGLESVASRVDDALAGEPATMSAEAALWLVAVSRGDHDAALRWSASFSERGRRRHDLSD
jgi:predicted ATPase